MSSITWAERRHPVLAAAGTATAATAAAITLLWLFTPQQAAVALALVAIVALVGWQHTLVELRRQALEHRAVISHYTAVIDMMEADIDAAAERADWAHESAAA